MNLFYPTIKGKEMLEKSETICKLEKTILYLCNLSVISPLPKFNMFDLFLTVP